MDIPKTVHRLTHLSRSGKSGRFKFDCQDISFLDETYRKVLYTCQYILFALFAERRGCYEKKSNICIMDICVCRFGFTGFLELRRRRRGRRGPRDKCRSHGGKLAKGRSRYFESSGYRQRASRNLRNHFPRDLIGGRLDDSIPDRQPSDDDHNGLEKKRIRHYLLHVRQFSDWLLAYGRMS